MSNLDNFKISRVGYIFLQKMHFNEEEWKMSPVENVNLLKISTGSFWRNISFRNEEIQESKKGHCSSN